MQIKQSEVEKSRKIMKPSLIPRCFSIVFLMSSDPQTMQGVVPHSCKKYLPTFSLLKKQNKKWVVVNDCSRFNSPVEHCVEGRHFVHANGRDLADFGHFVHCSQRKPAAALALSQVLTKNIFTK